MYQYMYYMKMCFKIWTDPGGSNAIVNKQFPYFAFDLWTTQTKQSTVVKQPKLMLY